MGYVGEFGRCIGQTVWYGGRYNMGMDDSVGNKTNIFRPRPDVQDQDQDQDRNCKTKTKTKTTATKPRPRPRPLHPDEY